jgi:hypothetical protein
VNENILVYSASGGAAVGADAASTGAEDDFAEAGAASAGADAASAGAAVSS